VLAIEALIPLQLGPFRLTCEYREIWEVLRAQPEIGIFVPYRRLLKIFRLCLASAPGSFRPDAGEMEQTWHCLLKQTDQLQLDPGKTVGAEADGKGLCDVRQNLSFLT